MFRSSPSFPESVVAAAAGGLLLPTKGVSVVRCEELPNATQEQADVKGWRWVDGWIGGLWFLCIYRAGDAYREHGFCLDALLIVDSLSFLADQKIFKGGRLQSTGAAYTTGRVLQCLIFWLMSCHVEIDEAVDASGMARLCCSAGASTTEIPAD